jgi:phenylpropionate dioxygenase-like ring-hydroxylating dioxygenase large terminal subunit
MTAVANARRLANPVALRDRNYPINQWWVAGVSAELTDKPIQRWILELPVVLYRGHNGAAVALDDRCPHRWAPLSSGYVSGDDIVCGYHGLQFGPDGRCTRVPTQAMAPDVAKVRRYPVVERVPFIWIWTGDPQAAETADPPPELAWATDPSRVTAEGAMEVGCNYMAIKENVLDLSHFGFVHAKTLAVTDWVSAPALRRGNDGTVSYVQEMASSPLPAHYGVPTGIGCERPVSRTSWGTYVNPALQTAGVDIDDPQPQAPGARTRFELRICHATTPIDLGRTAYWWFFSQDYGQGEGAVDKLKDRIEAAFLEDKLILEATEQMVARDPRGANYREMAVLCDRPAAEARRLLHKALHDDNELQAASRPAKT